MMSPKRIMFYILLFGFTVRLSVGLWSGYSLDSDYANIARNIVAGKGYSLDGSHPTAYRTPVYPIILAGIIALFGEQRIPFIIFLAIVGTINAGLCAYLGMRLFSRKAALMAGFIYSLVPYLARQEAKTESGLVTLGLIASLCLLLKWKNNRNFIWPFLSGILLAFSYLARPTVGIIPIFISFCLLADISHNRKMEPTRAKARGSYGRNTQAATIYPHPKGCGFRPRSIKRSIISAIILMLAFAIGICPWAIRNKIVFGRWYLTQTNFWYTVYIGNHTRTFKIYPYLSLDNFASIRPILNAPGFNNELEMEEWFRQKSLKEIQNSKLKDIVKHSLQKLGYLWHIRIIPHTQRIGNDPLTGKTLDKKRDFIQNLAFSLPYLFLIVFALRGGWQERKRRWLLFFAAGFLFSFSMPYMVTIAYSRYTTQVYFVLIILASRGIVSFIKTSGVDRFI